jgi:hypothetical protein
MTKDHIHPKAKGGAEKLENFQPMCSPCNSYKADDTFNQTQLDMINQLRLFSDTLNSLNKARREMRNAINQLKSRCQHVVDKTKTGSTKCKICGESFGWHCPQSKDSACHYLTEYDEQRDLRYILLVDGSKDYMDKGYSSKGETGGKCLDCTEPKARK